VSLVLSLLGAALAALFVVALAADLTSWWCCVRCGKPADHPVHFVCRVHRETCRSPHHAYAKPSWPFVVLGALMFAVALALLVVR